jgi:ribosomal protein S4
MTKLSLKKFKNSQFDISQKGRTQKSTEIFKIGVKNPNKVNMPKRQNTLTEYQSQYKAKQLIKSFYGGLSETTLKNIRKVASYTSTPLVCEIEKRLDVVLFRLGFARSIFEARTLIKGKFVSVNDKVINGNYGSYSKILLIGDKITIETTELAYLAKIKHLRLNMFKLPTHLMLSPFLNKNNNSYNPDYVGVNISLLATSEINLTNPQPTMAIALQGNNNLENNHSSEESFDIFNKEVQKDSLKIKLDGYFVKNPIESEVYLPYEFPINKLN